MSTAVLQRQLPAARPATAAPVSPLVYAARALFSYEALFLLFLFAGRFKSDPRFNFVTVDLTVLTLVLSAVGGFLIFCKKSYHVPPRAAWFLTVSGCFFAYAVASYSWSIGHHYAWQKAQYVGVLTTYPLLVFALIISSSRQRLTRFLYLVVAFGFWISFERFVSARQETLGDSEVLGGNYLGIGRVVGMAALICLVFGLRKAQRSDHRLALYGLVGLFAIVLLMCGGRMPCIATVAAALSIPIFSRPRRTTKSKQGSILVMLAIAVVAGYGVWKHGSNQVDFRTLRRMELLLTGSDFGGSGEQRLQLWRTALAACEERPFWGYGLGSFPVLHYREDVRSHPHNLFMEVAAETGGVGVALLVAMIALAYRNLSAGGGLRNDPLRLVVFVLLVNAGANAMVSGDIPDNRVFFGLLGLSCLVNPRVLPPWKKSPTSPRSTRPSTRGSSSRNAVRLPRPATTWS